MSTNYLAAWDEDWLAEQVNGHRQQKCRQAHAGLYQEAQRLIPLVQALADRERALEAENAELRRLLKQVVQAA